MSDEIAIKIKDVTKLYKLYDKPTDRLKESLGLSKKQRYKEHYALHNVSFEVKRGECVGIIGTNGAGKSTILKIITGVLNPTAGEVEINGRISALLELGAGFNMEYTGIENVYLNGTMIGFTKEEIDAKLQDILEFADIGDFVHQPVKTYSSGMFVRLAFAVAINIDPEILIVDEALSVGDVFFQLKCFKKFEEFKKQGKTILFVSHDLSSIERYCDRAVLMDHGRNVAEGVPIDIINKYKKIMTGMTVAEMEEQEKRRKEHLEAFASESQSDDKSGEMAEGQNDGKSDELAEGKVDDKSRETFNDQRTIGNDSSKRWSDHLDINPNLDEYGDGAAKLIDFGIFDEDGNITTTIIKGSTFTIRSKVEFKEDVDDPIFTYTFKTIKGQDITGTNTMYEKASVGLAKKGETYIASFTQEMNLQGGEYLLSMSCTSFVDGELVAHDRLYDVLNISVVSDKNTVGYYDMNSKVTIEKVL
ncbi:teichoic acid transport system ATP-binding protein [Lachnospiraceae bacterium NE2001]|nr:teichoic acid transport system ATP-binding protein [Lachnospiraceae bacterium NE2001]